MTMTVYDFPTDFEIQKSVIEIPQSILAQNRQIVNELNKIISKEYSINTGFESIDFEEVQVLEYNENKNSLTNPSGLLDLVIDTPINFAKREIKDSFCQLHLNSLHLTEIVKTFPSCPKKSSFSQSPLTTLKIQNSPIKKLPQKIGYLSKLETLNLINNQLEEIPETIGNLSQLKSLNIALNNLVNIPESLGELSNLESLDISFNKIRDSPDSFENLVELNNFCKESAYDAQIKLPDDFYYIGCNQDSYLERLIDKKRKKTYEGTQMVYDANEPPTFGSRWRDGREAYRPFSEETKLSLLMEHVADVLMDINDKYSQIDWSRAFDTSINPNEMYWRIIRNFDEMPMK